MAIKQKLNQSVKKVAERHFFEFCGFCLSLTLPGGKTRKVRKPLGFHPFDAHVVRAGLNIRGFLTD